MIGSLMYPRPDIFFAVKTFETCSPNGCKACRGTIDYGLKYDANQKINLEGYVDLYWVGSAIDRKSTSWCSRKQSYVALSTTKEKYVSS